jgi:hypothetical protein
MAIDALPVPVSLVVKAVAPAVGLPVARPVRPRPPLRPDSPTLPPEVREGFFETPNSGESYNG